MHPYTNYLLAVTVKESALPKIQSVGTLKRYVLPRTRSVHSITAARMHWLKMQKRLIFRKEEISKKAFAEFAPVLNRKTLKLTNIIKTTLRNHMGSTKEKAHFQI